MQFAYNLTKFSSLPQTKMGSVVARSPPSLTVRIAMYMFVHVCVCVSVCACACVWYVEVMS